ncbi:putative conjugal transfer proteinc [Clostridium puniceum]|uniref:Putative conjugal transfer proteinc n=1 Tax=Clostridium puniceum TaxID=29367 RepID=A0A1S8TS48_9CLOT|nr:CpaF family protein [Clostridium puniceum]OOM80588.1 putative conjugal transfer proteinc [Clostridium puniceum]
MSVENLIKIRQLEFENSINESSNFVENKIEAIDDKNESKLLIEKKIREKIIENYSFNEINSIEKFSIIRNAAWSMIEEEIDKNNFSIYLDSYDKAEIIEQVIHTIFGYGVLDPLISDPSITEIMVNGVNKIFVERNGVIERVENKSGEFLKFNNNDELLNVIEKIVAPINRKVDESNPIVDARLPNGFRVNILLSPISLEGHIITIRKFPESPYTIEKLVDFGMLPSKVANFLEKLVKSKYNIIVSGGTGAGKTTFLNALSNFIDGNERVITIEDAAELKLSSLNNIVRLETRPPNIEGNGEITMRELVRSALRMRPDRIIVGEVRGGEALDMLQAMNTGHDGSLSTGHANSSIDMLMRLETMVLMAGIDLPLISIRQQIASAVDLIIHLNKLQDGKRRLVEVTEILGVNEEGYITQNIFEFKRYYNNENGIGNLQYTGSAMKNLNKLEFAGIHFDELMNE